MLFKRFMFFYLSLLLVSISCYPSSEVETFPSKELLSLRLTERKREIFVKTFLDHHEKSADPNLIRSIAMFTDGHTIAQISMLMPYIIEESKGNTLERLSVLEKLEEAISQFDIDEMKKSKMRWLRKTAHKSLFAPLSYDSLKGNAELDRLEKDVELFEIDAVFPKADDRFEIIRMNLLLAGKDAPDSLKQDIVELTNDLDTYTIMGLVENMMKKTKTCFLDKNSCIEELKQLTDKVHDKKLREAKLKQIKAMASEKSLPKTSDDE